MRFQLAALGLIIAVNAGGGEVINRIAVVVGKNVIKQSDVTREIRMTDFLNGDKLDFSADARRKAAERLIDQKMIQQEMKAGRYPTAAPEEAERLLAQVKKDRFGGDQARYQNALKEYGITEQDLKAQLQWQIAVLRFID